MIGPRPFIMLLAGAAAAWLLLARAQQPDPARALWLDILHLQAEDAADKIGAFFGEIETQVGWTTQRPWSEGKFEGLLEGLTLTLFSTAWFSWRSRRRASRKMAGAGCSNDRAARIHHTSQQRSGVALAGANAAVSAAWTLR
jgi:hypothetical protein